MIDELERVRRECEALPGPGPATVAAARSALRAEIEASIAVAGGRSRRHRRRVWLLAVAGCAVLLIGVVALVFPAKRDPVGVEIAAAAYAALNPTGGEIVHVVSRSVSTTRIKLTGKATFSASVEEVWSSSSTPYRVRERHWNGTRRSGPYLSETETTACGQLGYLPASNTFELSPDTYMPLVDPAAGYRNAYRHGRVHYRGKTSFHGIPAFKLLVTQYGANNTLIVRRDNYYPLKTVTRRDIAKSVSTVVTTYSAFEYITRNHGNEHLLHVAAHPGAFFLRLAAPMPGGKACRGFGDSHSLTAGGRTP